MTRYCTKCAAPLDDARVRRGCVFCSQECKMQNDRERRALLREKRCETCHRVFRKRVAGRASAVAAEGQ